MCYFWRCFRILVFKLFVVIVHHRGPLMRSQIWMHICEYFPFLAQLCSECKCPKSKNVNWSNWTGSSSCFIVKRKRNILRPSRTIGRENSRNITLGATIPLRLTPKFTWPLLSAWAPSGRDPVAPPQKGNKVSVLYVCILELRGQWALFPDCSFVEKTSVMPRPKP